jgi:hypothetical protein
MTKKIEHGTKYDHGKPRFELIAPDAELWLAKILTHGAVKYEDNNWTGLTTKRVLGALKRHLNAIERGEDIDTEGDNPSNMPHHAHLLTNAMFLCHILENYPEQDDRPFKNIVQKTTKPIKKAK